MRIGILEDEALIADHLTSVIEDKGYEVCFVSDTVKDAKEQLKKNIDFLLLDIKVNGKLSGIDLAEHVNLNYSIPFIFISSNTDQHTLEKVKHAKPYGFLTKPFKNIDIEMAIDLALEKHAAVRQNPSSKNNFIFLKDKGSWIKVVLDNLLYLQASDNYTVLFFEKDSFLITQNLKYFEGILPHEQFFKTHRSYLINKNFIESYSGDSILINSTSIPVSSTYKFEIDELFKNNKSV